MCIYRLIHVKRSKYHKHQHLRYIVYCVFDSLYGATLAKKTSYLTLHSSVFEASGTVNYDCIFTDSINSL